MPDTITLPLEEYEALRTAADELDRRDYQAAAAAARDGEWLSHEMVKRLSSGEHPIKVWREYRKLSQVALAERAGIAKSYVSQIESGARDGTMATYTALAEALDVTLDDLASWTD